MKNDMPMGQNSGSNGGERDSSGLFAAEDLFAAGAWEQPAAGEALAAKADGVPAGQETQAQSAGTTPEIFYAAGPVKESTKGQMTQWEEQPIAVSDAVPEEAVARIKRKGKFKLRYVLLPLLALAILGAVLFNMLGGGAPVTFVEAQPPETTTLTQKLNLTGTFQTGDKQTVFMPAESAGLQVAEVYAEVGDFVQEGDLLITFDTRDLAYRLEQANAALKQLLYANQDAYTRADALAALYSEQAGLQAQVNALNAAKAGKTPEETALLDVQIAAAYARLEALGAKIATSQMDYLTQATRIGMENRRKDQVKMRDDAARVLSVASQGLIAPQSGVVTVLTAQAGASSMPGGQAFTVESTANVDLYVTLSSSELGRVTVGQAAAITAAGHSYAGSVSRLDTIARQEMSAQGTAKGKAGAYLRVENPDSYILLGMEGNATIITAERKGVLAVPYGAVITDNEGTYCYVVEEGKALRKPVTLGISSETLSEITSGLAAGDMVITTPEMVQDGMAVTTDEALRPASQIRPFGMG